MRAKPQIPSPLMGEGQGEGETAQSQKTQFRQLPLDITSHLYYHGKCTHIWSQIDGSGQLIKSKLDERIRTNTLTASTDTFKVIETIDDRVGGYNFLPTLIESCSRRKQCPLYLVNSESSFLGCAGETIVASKAGRGVLCSPRITSQSTQPESVRASRAVVDAYDVNPISLHGRDDGVSRGPTR